MGTSEDKFIEIKEDTFEKWEQEFRKNHPIRYWIDTRMFKNKGIFGMRTSYVLSHPWKIIEEFFREIKWAYQRIFRGWDDRVIWSIDYYLSEVIPQWMDTLKKEKRGIPIEMFNPDDWDKKNSCYKDGTEDIASEKWDKILEDIRNGFLANKKIHDDDLWTNKPEYDKLNDVFNEGFDLFKKYFGNLWN